LEEAIQLFYAGDDTGGVGIQANTPAQVAWKEPPESSELGPRFGFSCVFFCFIYAVLSNIGSISSTMFSILWLHQSR
jgi:hypothetical protein